MKTIEITVDAKGNATVATPYGKVRVKVGALDGEILGAQPEFDDCRRLATRAQVPAREVLAAAAAAARALLPRRTRRPRA